MRARRGVRSDGHDGVASAEDRAREPAAIGRRRTRRGERSEASRLDDLERKEERRAGVAVRSIPAAHLEDRRVDAGRLARDDPALVADANRLAGSE